MVPTPFVLPSRVILGINLHFRCFCVLPPRRTLPCKVVFQCRQHLIHPHAPLCVCVGMSSWAGSNTHRTGRGLRHDALPFMVKVASRLSFPSLSPTSPDPLSQDRTSRDAVLAGCSMVAPTVAVILAASSSYFQYSSITSLLV